jgi:hypothetical protein
MTKTVTISALRSDLTPYAHHDVIVTLIAGSAGGVVGSSVVVESSTVRLDANGAGSIVLETNDVITPAGTFYRFTVADSSPTISRSIALTTATAATVSWSLAGIQVGDPTEPQREVSSDFVTVGAESLTNYLANGTGADVHYAVAVIDPTTDLTAFTTTDVLDPITWATVTPDFDRGDLVGQTVAISSGANIGLYLVTASGPCTPLSPQPEVGEQIAVLAGGDNASPAVVIAVGTVAPTEYQGVKGVVRSVNDVTGAVVIDADSVGADPAGTAASAISALGLGTAATKNVPATGDASATEVVKGDDTRLSDARTPAAHNQAASTITSGTLDIARIPTGTTSTTVPLGNDSRFSDARTPTAHKSSHAPGGSDVLGVGHFAPDLPGVLGLGRRVGANVTVTRGMCMWIPMPLLAVPAKATTIWVKTATGVASCAMTGAICAAKSASLDAPGTILGSTSVGAMSLASSSAVVGGTLTSPVTLAAGVRYFVQIIALNGASNPTAQGADGLTEGNNWENGSAGPVTPTAGIDTAGIFVWSGRSALEDNPPRASYVSSNTKPFVYLSLEAP